MYTRSEYGGRGGRRGAFVAGFAIGVGALVAATLLAVLLAAYGKALHPRFSVDDASLARFALNTSPATALSYNLTLSLAVRNPNWAMSVTYGSLDADYLFAGERFGGTRAVEQGYVQPPRRTCVVRLSAGEDRARVALDAAAVAEYGRESAAGEFHVDVALSGEVRYKLRPTWCRLAVRCPLKLQVATPGATTVMFQKTECEVLRSPQMGC